MRFHWRQLIIAAISSYALFGIQAQAAATAGNLAGKTIMVVGDSLSAEYGLERGSGWVALIARRLEAKKSEYRIENASISGDTSSSGLSRLPAALKLHSPSIVIVELGSNDALRGLSLKMTERNLSTIIMAAQQAGARVLLLGMEIPPNYGRRYAQQFKQMYSALADQYGVGLVPFLFEGIATDRKQFQADGIHPNEQAQPTLANNVWSELEPMLEP